MLAEYYAAKNYGVQVIGCPKTERDCNSARKYWHFIKVMGRSASHIALECALQTQPNICLVSEEIEQKGMSLDDIVTYIANAVCQRAADGNNFGTVIIPEGVIEFIPAIKKLIAQLNDVLALPEAKNLDRHESIDLVAQKLEKMKKEGKYAGKFSAQHHFFGYEGRCAAPSNFDADYCYALGTSAAQLIANGKTGYMAIVKNTTAPAEQWIAGGVPITMMMNMEKRAGEMKPVIRKALVELDGAPFKAFAAQRDRWARETAYVYPGPIQYWGPTEVCDQPTRTLALEQSK